MIEEEKKEIIEEEKVAPMTANQNNPVMLI